MKLNCLIGAVALLAVCVAGMMYCVIRAGALADERMEALMQWKEQGEADDG
ncbi:MAG: hypothetical protein LUE92_10950 [Clostridiales bacterium]|nr:hypothetical protein [Clostridiales bacterium]